MTVLEKQWFESLAEDRKENARTLMKASMRGVWRAIVDKYSDQAHFIYELLQNADDAGATTAEFRLEQRRLLFKHNGAKRFSITSPETEEEDFKSGAIGDLNSITGAGGFSTKWMENTKGNAIGKFGVGFKAVFQYTTSPEIYDDNIAFRLEDYIVPHLITSDEEWRKSGETLFVFPLNKEGVKNPWQDIWQKLNALIFPTLFLNNLKSVNFDNGKESGSYAIKDVLPLAVCDGYTVKKVDVISNTNNAIHKDRIWLFSRTDDRGNSFSVGYMVDQSGKLKPVDYKAFCYFPTKHDTKLKFIVHAPFLLTDSREGIKANEEHNVKMISELAQLAADSLKHLCKESKNAKDRVVTDDVVKVIPITEEDYGDGISFDVFRKCFCDLFGRETVVPTTNAYVDRWRGYWAESIKLPQLFTDEQLRELKDEEGVCWAFPTIPQERRWTSAEKIGGVEVFDFIEKCVNEIVSDNEMIGLLTAEFVEKQSFAWLEGLYKWISGNEDRINAARCAPIFLDQNGKACAAFGEDDKVNLYLPLEGDTRFHFVNEKILKSKTAGKLIKAYDLKEPRKDDYVRLLIDEKFEDATDRQCDKYFKQIFGYYVTLPSGERQALAEEMSRKVRLRCFKALGNDACYMTINLAYIPSEILRCYFKEAEKIKLSEWSKDCEQSVVDFVDIKYYRELVGARYQKELDELIESMGASTFPIVREWEYGSTYLYFKEAKSKGFHYNTERKSYLEKFRVRRVEGASGYLRRIIKEKDFGKKQEMSVYLWNVLKLSARNFKRDDIYSMVGDDTRNFLTGVHVYEYYGTKEEGFDSPQLAELRGGKWLIADEWTTVSPQEIAVSELPPCYDVHDADDLIEALGMVRVGANDAAYQAKMRAREALTEEDRCNVKLGEFAKSLGLSEEDLREKAAEKRAAAMRCEAHDIVDESEDTDNHNRRSHLRVDSVESEEEAPKKRPRPNSVIEAIEETVDEIKKTNGSVRNALPNPFADDDEDGDELTPKTIDFEKRIKDRTLRQAGEIATLEKGKEYQEEAGKFEKYSYGWFKAMLGLEMLGMEEDAVNRREISIAFTRIEKELGFEHTYILKRPSRNIPQWVEELSDVPLDMLIGKRTLRPRIEAMSVKSFDLRVKFKSDEILEGLDLRELKEARFAVQRPDFLLTSLRDGFEKLGFDATKSLLNDLPEDVEFIFGPPGTGKTTFLARDRIINLMNRGEGKKVLVLTPTNKAADVLASRVMSCMNDGESAKDWLVRFGSTGDEDIEKAGVKCGKDVDIARMDRCCIITTIARFPYDKYVPGNAEPVCIEEIKWDYVVIDEASMIPLVNIVYVLYRKKGTKFIIAGDPFQIDPIIKNEGWKGENVYTMVGLDDFTNPTTRPRQYAIRKLTTQYRSVPVIGDLFSRYRYGGMLAHARSGSEVNKLKVLGLQQMNPLTIIKFPVSQWESIYSPKRLKSGVDGGSPYQIYSALFVFEYVCALAMKRVRGGAVFRIGVISPYKAQADLVQRLIESVHLPDDVEISAGTVHGFQGDECDMIVALFNPPPGLAGGQRAFVNRKNIVNVAMSRAKDYFVLVMPDDDTVRIENMVEVRKVERLMRESTGAMRILKSSDVEKWMFGTSTFIEDNSFSSGHQSVNVYGLPERRYEVRSEDSAVDIQIHDTKGAVRNGALSASQVGGGCAEFLSFMKSRVNVNVAKVKALQYRAVLGKYRDLKHRGAGERRMAAAYQELRNAATFFHDYYMEFCKIRRDAPKFGMVMSYIINKLNVDGSLW